MNVNYIYRANHFTIYTYIKPLLGAPSNHMMLYVNEISIKLEKNKILKRKKL